MKKKTDYKPKTRTPQKSERRIGKAPHALQICTWIALGYSDKEIITRLRDDFDYHVERCNIHTNYRKAKRQFINKLKERIARNLLSIPIARKEVRLQILAEAIKDAQQYSVKTITKDGDIIEERKTGLIPQLIREARQEVEGIIIHEKKDIKLTIEEKNERFNRLREAIADGYFTEN